MTLPVNVTFDPNVEIPDEFTLPVILPSNCCALAIPAYAILLPTVYSSHGLTVCVVVPIPVLN